MTVLEHRIPPPLVAVLTAVVMWLASRVLPPTPFDATVRIALGAATAIGGGVIGVLAFREFEQAKTTINPVAIDAASALVTTGVFGWTRNPMYLSLTLVLTGLALFLGSPWLAAGPIAFALFINRFQIVPEERVMAAKFAAPFAAYRQRVRRWL